jgi:hypothetical protein
MKIQKEKLLFSVRRLSVEIADNNSIEINNGEEKL